MTRTIDDVVDLLRRAGPGALPATRIRRELRRRHAPPRATTTALRALAANSDGRILWLEARVDRLSGRRSDRDVFVAWMVLMWPDDEPDQSELAGQLWRSLAALAATVDPACRAEVCRWALQARQASLALRKAFVAARQGELGQPRRRP